MLRTIGLAKDFRDQWRSWRWHPVLRDVSFSVNEGEIFGLIGPNGAGKTTTFKLLLGFLRPTRGAITFRGRPLDGGARARIGFLPEQPYFYDHLTVRETLDFYARLYGMDAAGRRQRVAEVIEQVQLGPKRNASLRTLSKGTLQRIGVAQAILNRPDLAILDEPMSGLDPAGRHHMRELILSLCDTGTTVIFSSHILPDAEAVCNRVGVLVDGRLQEVVELHRGTEAEAYLITVSDVAAAALATLEKIAGTPGVAGSRTWSFRLPGATAVRRALDVVRECDGFVHSLTPVQPSLEERFLRHVGHVAQLD
ncbi:MAG: ATP-binding cassette domain-containing protein [Candidatus Binatia bacterium]